MGNVTPAEPTATVATLSSLEPAPEDTVHVACLTCGQAGCGGVIETIVADNAALDCVVCIIVDEASPGRCVHCGAEL